MTSTFPTAPDNISATMTNSTVLVDIHPTHHNDLANAVNAVEASLLSGGAFSAGRSSLLVDGGFEIWQRGSGAFTTTGTYSADRWLLTLVGTDTCSVSRDTTNVNNSLAAAACVFVLGSGAGATAISQAVGRASDGLEQLKNKTVSFAIDARTATASAVRAWVSPDGGTTRTYNSYHTGGSTWQRLTVSLALGAGTDVRVGVAFAASCTAYLDNAMLVVGSVAADYAPLHPADDLARCLRYYEHIASPTGYVVSGYTAAGGNIRSAYPFRVIKAVTPTVTRVGTWNIANMTGQPSVTSTDTTWAWLQGTATALGDTFWYLGAGHDLTIEANP